MQNKRVKNLKKELLSDNWYRLEKVTFDYQLCNGRWETHTREAYDRGNGATILLYNISKKTVILTRQFRVPTYLNGNQTGMLIEACAGLLDRANPEDCIRKETEEETGYQVKSVQKVFKAYMSPGSVTEILHFFVAEYTEEMKISDGGGVKEEQENIEVLEIPLSEAYAMIGTGEICDGKTIMLLQYLMLSELVKYH
ncbi:nudix-type nucleoside diphosphatase, YffH/AdpP family [Aquiflexum balticum DSM 16537]|uniref:GDP-mannose pyrophosphatase n=1 Tax=Aquiflexum balticum DSM 16537 TaxID=758820 RepID=A0A1W2H7T3_9BACT|nr:GDP-mannose pyrophosphatase NudK [Aquiflexum balticum]SMD44834.1 nudix-type nucleoside diphosphatase, YffH/AdpP family [Aquiflexum balticum DSM 16537]